MNEHRWHQTRHWKGGVSVNDALAAAEIRDTQPRNSRTVSNMSSELIELVGWQDAAKIVANNRHGTEAEQVERLAALIEKIQLEQDFPTQAAGDFDPVADLRYSPC